MFKPEIYDIETLVNLFLYIGYTPHDNKWYIYVIHDSLNQSSELYEHLTRGNFFHVGFNNLDFDYPILHYFLSNWNSEKKLKPYHLANVLYNEGQKIINNEEKNSIYYKNYLIRQIDLYKIWHYNSPAKRTSLKDLEFSMRMENIEDMPLEHYKECNNNDINTIIEYCKNDVLATYNFYNITLGNTNNPLYKGKNKLLLRKNLNKKFNVNSYNWSESKIGENLLLYLYCRKLNLDPKLVKTWKTYHDKIYLNKCIPYWCDIKSKEFNILLDTIKNTVITKDNDFSTSIYYHNIKFDFGSGGAHGCIKSGIYKSDNSYIIMDLDINSLYPSIAKSLQLYPEHLGIQFNELYSSFVDSRLLEKSKSPNNRDETLIESYKAILNIVYGKSREEKSFLYDLYYAYRTVIAGQCFICMWAEKLVESCKDLIFLSINTDGLTIKIPINKIDNIKEVCNNLQKLTGLSSQICFYKQIIIKDVNNYIAEYNDSTIDNEHIKLKGCFEIDKEYHKDSSMRIVPIALKNLFIYNIPIQETIKNHKDIFDFCIRLKLNHSSKGFYYYLDKNQIKYINLSKTTRYFASNNGGSISVVYNNSSTINQLNKQYQFSLFNKYYYSDNYDINYNYYISEANKIYNSIIDNQLNLF